MEVINTESIVNINETPSSRYKTPDYTLRAVRNYQQKNREKLNESARNRWREKYNDPEFREKERKRLMERYYRKKQEKNIT
jgi:hypothetical protein